MWSLSAYVNSGLLPLAGLLYSAMNSWHCVVMCGPFVSAGEPRVINALLIFRLISYTCLGGAFGFLGRQIRDSLAFDAIGIVSFSLFSVFSILCIFPFLFPRFKKFAPLALFSKFRGLMWGFMPCHLLLFYYGIALLTGSTFVGAALLFSHAVMTTPALAYTNYFMKKFSPKSQLVKNTLRFVLAALVIASLVIFWQRITKNREGNPNGANKLICLG